MFGQTGPIFKISFFGLVHHVLPGKKKHNFRWFATVKIGTKKSQKNKQICHKNIVLNKVAKKIENLLFLKKKIQFFSFFGAVKSKRIQISRNKRVL